MVVCKLHGEELDIAERNEVLSARMFQNARRKAWPWGYGRQQSPLDEGYGQGLWRGRVEWQRQYGDRGL